MRKAQDLVLSKGLLGFPASFLEAVFLVAASEWLIWGQDSMSYSWDLTIVVSKEKLKAWSSLSS